MGLDQYFYNKKQEIVYFKKHNGLHTFITSLGYDLKNGEDTFIKPEHLIDIANYLVGADYWGKLLDDEDDIPTDGFLQNVGTIYYMGITKQGLYYNADW